VRAERPVSAHHSSLDRCRTGGSDVGKHRRKPFAGVLRVTNPAGESLASTPKRVLRRAGAIRSAKRRQPVLRRCYGASKCQLVGALALAIRGGRAVLPQGPGNDGPTGVAEQRIGTGGHPWNLRGPGPLHADHSGRRPDYQLLAPGLPPGPRGAKRQTYRVVAPSEGNEARRQGGRASQRPIVLQPGEPYPKGPAPGKGAPVHRTGGGKHARCFGT
jgi:hypothetical protein